MAVEKETAPASAPVALPHILTAEYRFPSSGKADAEKTCRYWHDLAVNKATCNPHGTDAPYVVTNVVMRDNPFEGCIVVATMRRVIPV